MKTNKAFTLLELLVIFIIAAILIASTYSAYITFYGSNNGLVTVIQFGERYHGKIISEDANSVTIKTLNGRTATITKPYTIYK